jgi:chromosome segregation ATPase
MFNYNNNSGQQHQHQQQNERNFWNILNNAYDLDGLKHIAEKLKELLNKDQINEQQLLNAQVDATKANERIEEEMEKLFEEKKRLEEELKECKKKKIELFQQANSLNEKLQETQKNLEEFK